MLSSDQEPSQIEKIVDCGMGHQGISEPAQLTTIFATFPPSKTNYQPGVVDEVDASQVTQALAGHQRRQLRQLRQLRRV